MIFWARVDGLLATVAAIFFAGYHFGGMASKTALEGFLAAQAENTAKAVLAERESAVMNLARMNAVVKGYQDEKLDPVAVTLGSRVLQYARIADCPVPKAAANPGGARNPAPLPIGPSDVGQALTEFIEACSRDARQLTALQAAWPN